MGADLDKQKRDLRSLVDRGFKLPDIAVTMDLSEADVQVLAGQAGIELAE